MTTPLRIALFIDAQNAYRRARDRSFPNPQSNVDGQFDPIRLGQLIASRGGPGGMPCSLSDVRIYSGRPDPNRDKRSHAAHMRQSNRWRANGATVVTQDLRYPPTWPTDPAQEKGIDVALAIDFVRLAITWRLRRRCHDVHRHRPAAGTEVRLRPRSGRYLRCSGSLGYPYGQQETTAARRQRLVPLAGPDGLQRRGGSDQVLTPVGGVRSVITHNGCYANQYEDQKDDGRFQAQVCHSKPVRRKR